MRAGWRAIAAGALGLSAGCATLPLQVAERLNLSGWFEVDASAAPRDYRARFTRTPLDGAAQGCEAVHPGGTGPALVLVPGVFGDGPEWERLIPRLSLMDPAGVYLFRWVPYDERDALSARLAAGLHRLSRCLPPERKILVLAHSAGGVIASYAAVRARVEPGPEDQPRLIILTVASPLAGTQLLQGADDEEPRFFFDLATSLSRYPYPGAGVEVYHLRTQYPADSVMGPKLMGGAPNDPRIHVPGARQVNLPPSIGHVEALGYVGQRLLDGTWESWRRPRAQDVTVF